ELAARYLVGLGYRILARYLRLPGGEIDILAREGDCLAVVEVRTRRGRSHGTPEESVTPAKQARLRLLAERYLQTLPEPEPCRVDVVAVELSPAGKLLRLDLYRDALT
ncbi:MAG: YraN family protein, partial [Chloroflexota bacterium]